MNQTYSATSRVWWLLLIRGIFAVILGLLCLFSPNSTLIAFVLIFGFYAIVDGVSAIYMAISSRKEQKLWSWVLLEGIISLVAGLVALAWPGVTLLAIGFIIGFWAVFLGATQISTSISLRRQGSSVWGWLLATGIVSVLWGAFVFIAPSVGLLSVLWIFGIFALIFGIWIIGMSLQVRKGLKEVNVI